jgi:hypothetical protein
MKFELSWFTLSKEPRQGWQISQRFKIKVHPIGYPDFEIGGMLAEEVSLILNDELSWVPDCDSANVGKSLDWHLICPERWHLPVGFYAPPKEEEVAPAPAAREPYSSGIRITMPLKD